MTLFCVGCDHFTRTAGGENLCERPGAWGKPSPVTGLRADNRMTCEIERSRWAFMFPGRCGPEGKFWEPKRGPSKPPPAKND